MAIRESPQKTVRTYTVVMMEIRATMANTVSIFHLFSELARRLIWILTLGIVFSFVLFSNSSVHNGRSIHCGDT